MTFRFMNDCIFCKIAKKEAPAEILYEDELLVAFPDVHPFAPVHILIIPKKHIESITDLEEDDELLAGRMVIVAKKLAEQKGISEDGYKLLLRVGRHGGQEVLHMHLHLIGGAQLAEGIHPVK